MSRADHAPLPPSSADMIWGCPGSVRMQGSQPEQEETEEAREGTAAHWVLSETLLDRPVTIGMIAPNGVPVNEEMIEAIEAIVTDIRDTLAGASPGSLLRVEQKVAAPKLVHKDFYGTPDAYLIDRQRATLHVWDFKYGHRFVEIFENWQLLGYAACIVESEGIADPINWTYTFTIGQPRCYVRDVLDEGGVRPWLARGSIVMGKISNLSAACDIAMSPDAQCRTGPHCLDCLAAWDCEANQRAGGVSVDLIHSQQYSGMDAAAIGLELKVLDDAEDRVKARKNALTAKAQALAERGENIPWHGLKIGETRTLWDKTKVPEAANLVAMFGVPVSRGVALPTPAQCIKQGVDAAVITPYTTKANGAKKLVRIDDNHAAKVFGSRRAIK